MDTVVITLRVVTATADRESAARSCRPFAERHGFAVTAVAEVPDGAMDGGPHFEVRLDRTEPLHAGEDVGAALRRCGEPVFGLFSQADSFELDMVHRQAVAAAFDDVSGVVVPGAWISLMVRMSDVEDQFDNSEWLVPEPGEPLDPESLREAAELLSFVHATKVLLTADAVGLDREAAVTALVERLGPVPAEVLPPEPPRAGQDVTRVQALLVVAEGPVEELVDHATEALDEVGWSVVESGARCTRLVWLPDVRPAVGFFRFELSIGVDLRYEEAPAPP